MERRLFLVHRLNEVILHGFVPLGREHSWVQLLILCVKEELRRDWVLKGCVILRAHFKLQNVGLLTCGQRLNCVHFIVKIITHPTLKSQSKQSLACLLTSAYLRCLRNHNRSKSAFCVCASLSPSKSVKSRQHSLVPSQLSNRHCVPTSTLEQRCL